MWVEIDDFLAQYLAVFEFNSLEFIFVIRLKCCKVLLGYLSTKMSQSYLKMFIMMSFQDAPFYNTTQKLEKILLF